MRVVILGSGHGSNARAILESQKKGNLGNAIVVGIVSDRDDAGILEIANQYSIPSSVAKCSQIKAKLSDFDKEIFINKINVFNPDLSWRVYENSSVYFYRIFQKADHQYLPTTAMF